MQILFSLEIVANEVTVTMGKTSIHFEKASMTTNNILYYSLVDQRSQYEVKTTGVKAMATDEWEPQEEHYDFPDMRDNSLP